MKHRKTIAYGMIMMMLLQLFTGSSVQTVYADDAIQTVTQVELAFSKVDSSEEIAENSVFIPEDCTEKDGQQAWSVAYKITNWNQINDDEKEKVSLYLTVARKDLQDADAVEMEVVKDYPIIANSINNTVWNVGESYAVEASCTEAGMIYIKKPEDNEKYEYNITVAAKKDDVEFGKKSVKVQYVDNTPDICMRDVTPENSVVAKTADGIESDTWTKDKVTFKVEIKDAYIGVKKVSFWLDGIELADKQLRYEDNIQKDTVSQSFEVDTSATDVKGHTFEVIVTNAREVDTTWTRYILLDQDAPTIGGLTISETGDLVKNTTYRRPVTLTTRVVDGLSSVATVIYNITKDGENTQSVPVPADGNQTDWYSYQFNEDGVYKVSVSAEDKAGNIVTSTEEAIFRVDGIGPVITQQSEQQEGVYYKDAQVFKYRVTDANLLGGKSKILVKRDGTEIESSENSDVIDNSYINGSYECTKDGQYEIDVDAEDVVGNKAQQPLHCSFVVDQTAPVFVITAKDEEQQTIRNNAMVNRKVHVSYSVTDRNHNISAYKVNITRKDAAGNAYPVNQTLNWVMSDADRDGNITAFWECDYSEEGAYTITLEGKDKAGNDGQAKTFSFIIDKTAPEITDITYKTLDNMVLDPKYSTIFHNDKIQVSFVVEDKLVGLRDEEPVKVSVGTAAEAMGGEFYEARAGLRPGVYYVNIPLETLAAFDNKITIWAYDKAGNIKSAESLRTVYNTDPATLTVDCTTGNEGNWTNKDVEYAATVTDTRCGLQSVTCTKIENVNGVPQSTKIYTKEYTEYTEKDSTIKFKIGDTAKSVDGYILRIEVKNNCGTIKEETRKIYIDKEAPEVELSGITDGAHYRSDQTITAKVKDISYKAAPAPADQKKRTTTQYYVTCQYDGQSKTVAWDDFVSNQYEDSDKQTFSQEGYYEVYAVTTDGAGNKTTSNTLKFAIDKQPPVIESVRILKGRMQPEQFANPDGTYYVNEDARLDVQVTDHFPSPSTYIFVKGELENAIVQDEAFAITSSPYQFLTNIPYTAEGKYAVLLTGKDKAGNESAPVARDIVVDKTSPKLSIEGIESGKMTRDAVSLTYRSVDKNHDFDQYKVTVRRTDLAGTNEVFVEQNAADWTKTGCDADKQQDYITTKTSTYTTEGNYEVTLEGVDKAGNAGIAQTITFSIDHTAPVISDISYSDVYGLLAPKYGIIFSNQMIQVKFQVTDQVVGVEDSYVYVTLGEAKDRLADAPLYMARKGEQGYYYVYVPSDVILTEYDGVITLWANDRLRNESNAQTIRMIQNTDKPEIVMDCDLDYTKWQSRDVTFHTKVADNKSGLKEVTYSIDGKEVKKIEFTEFVKEYTYDLTATKTADKVSGYTVDIQVMNNNGTESEASRQVYIDKEPPVIKLSGVQNGTHYNKTQTVKTEVEDVSFKNTKTEYYVTRTLDGKTYKEKYAAFTMRKYEDQCTRRFGGEGRYQVYAVTTDSAGNRTKSNTLRFVVDKTAPKLAISGIENGSMNGNAVTLQFDLTDSFYTTTDASIRIEKTLDGGTTRSEVTSFPKKAKHSTLSRTFEEDGTYDITFTAKDRAGNVAKTRKISFSVDQTKPEIQITGTSNYEQWNRPVTVRFAVEESYYAGNHITIQGTRQDINGNVEELELPAIANTAKLSSLTQTFSKDGIYDFSISTKDEAGNQDEKEIHFILDQTRPEIHKVAQYQGGYYQEFKIADTLEEVFKDLTVVSYRILLNGIEYDGVTPVTEEGKYNLSVEVQDELGHKSTENAEFIIDHTAPKVIFTGVKDGQSVTESGSVTLSLTNPEDEITAVSMNGVEYDADTRQLDYTEYGSYHIDVECIDKAGNHVVRTIQFTYHNPLTTIILFAIMGGLIVMTCIWLWVRSIRKEKEEEKI